MGSGSSVVGTLDVRRSTIFLIGTESSQKNAELFNFSLCCPESLGICESDWDEIRAKKRPLPFDLSGYDPRFVRSVVFVRFLTPDAGCKNLSTWDPLAIPRFINCTSNMKLWVWMEPSCWLETLPTPYWCVYYRWRVLALIRAQIHGSHNSAMAVSRFFVSPGP